MISCLVFYCLIGFSMASNSTSGSTENLSCSKSIMCYIKGNTIESDTTLVNLEPKDIPNECEVIIYSRFQVDSFSNINVDDVALEAVVALNKPVIVTITRRDFYTDWGIVLGPDGNAKETKVLCDFATKYGVSGFILENLKPLKSFDQDYNDKIQQYIIPYIKQLKSCSDLIIGVRVEACGSYLNCPCLYNFAEMNDLVTFYEISTFALNDCDPTVYNGMTPITKAAQGSKYEFGMEDIAMHLKESKIDLTKLYYDIEMYPLHLNVLTYTSYAQVCGPKLNVSSWCIQTTTNFFEKGEFAREQDSGIIVKALDLDDINNACGCKSAFIGLKNIIAGLRCGQKICCAKFDVQSNHYNIE